MSINNSFLKISSIKIIKKSNLLRRFIIKYYKENTANKQFYI